MPKGAQTMTEFQHSRQAIISKIAKLFEMSKVDNEHQAQAMAEKAQALLHEHNVEQWEIEAARTDRTIRQKPVKVEIPLASRDETFHKFLWSALARGFSSFPVVITGRNPKLVMVGYQSDVDVAVMIYERLVALEPGLRAAAYRVYTSTAAGAAEAHRYKNLPNVYRRSWQQGFVAGIESQIAEGKRKLDTSSASSMALMVVKNTDVTAEVQGQFPDLKNGRRNKGSSHRGAMGQGYDTGRKTSLHAGELREGGK